MFPSSSFCFRFAAGFKSVYWHFKLYTVFSTCCTWNNCIRYCVGNSFCTNPLALLCFIITKVMMSDLSLTCNFPKCKAPITHLGLSKVTRCSHIFCDIHKFSDTGFNNKCPACGSMLDHDKDVVDSNLHLPEELKSVSLYLMHISQSKLVPKIMLSYQATQPSKFQLLLLPMSQRRLATRQWNFNASWTKHFK